MIIVVAILIIAGLAALAATTAPSSSTSTTSTYISTGADAIVASAAQTSPSGFTLESSKAAASGSTRSGDWALLGNSDGSVANVTAVVYPTVNASQAHFDSFVAGVKGLPGYTDISSDVASFQQYGKCYGYGEDVDGIAVANGVCTKGNVFLQVHLVSGIAFSDLEGDLTSIMGALYQSAT